MIVGGVAFFMLKSRFLDVYIIQRLSVGRRIGQTLVKIVQGDICLSNVLYGLVLDVVSF